MTFYFNLESLVLPDSQVHHFYTSSSRPIFGPSRFELNGVSSSARGSVARTIEASRDNRRLNTDSDSLVSYYNEQGCTPVSEYNAGDKHWLLIGDVRRYYPSFNSRS